MSTIVADTIQNTSGNVPDIGINSVMETWYYDTQDRAHSNNDHLYVSWSKYTTQGTANLGTGLTNESGLSTFKFSSTGYWLITLNFCFYSGAATNSQGIVLMYSDDGGSTDDEAQMSYQNTRASGAHANIILPHTFKITDTTNQQFYYKISGSNITVRGGGDAAYSNTTKMHVLKLRGL